MSGLTGNWSRLFEILSLSNLKSELKKGKEKAAQHGVKLIRQNIESGKNLLPLSSYTIQHKGSSKPLIETGKLLNSIGYEIDDEGRVFIGVTDSSEAVIAAVHEEGCTVRVTDKMRAYLHYEGLHLRASTQYINIPARSFIRPVAESEGFRNGITEIFTGVLREALTV